MVEVNVQAETSELTRLFSQLSKSAIAGATSDAINRSLRSGRTEGRREVKKHYNIPSRYLSFVDFSRSKPSTLTGYIYGRTIPLPMDAFNPSFQIISGSSVRGVTSISRRGIARTSINKRSPKTVLGVSIEVVKGRKSRVPYAFLIPGSKPRVFARGDYKSGGSYSFIRRHRREENSRGNDRVTNLLSVTVYGALVSNMVKKSMEEKLTKTYPNSLLNALTRRIKP